MAPNWMKTGSSPPSPPPPAGALEAFKRFVEVETFQECLSEHAKLLELLSMKPGRFHEFYPKFKKALKEHVPFKHKEIFKILKEKSKQKPYLGAPAESQRVLVVGAGPIGLRAAIEAQLLGAQVVVVERRDEFTRHNILKLWKFLQQDFKALAVKKFVGDFCSGSINHIGIKTLQLFLVKICLLLGVRVQTPMSLTGLIEPQEDVGWTAKLNPSGTDLDSFEFDMLIVASGKKVAVEGFDRRSLDAKLSIAVTANFKNTGTKEEKLVNEISGISKQYNQDFFKKMKESNGVDLENIVYYRGETHYFVMTALRSSLIEKGVILEDKSERKELMAPSNIDRSKLHAFAIEAAQFSTKEFSHALPVTDFAVDAHGNPDCAVFDFTNLYSARNACAVKVRNGCQLLMAVVGDSLLEPFWPEGTGCGRGVLSALDAAWLLRQWAVAQINPLEILTERENIYKLLSQTTDGASSELKEDFKAYTINPKTRYRNISNKIEHEKILALYDSDMPEEFAFIQEKFVSKQFYESKAHKTLLQKLRKGIVNKMPKKLKRQRTVVSEPEQATQLA